ncbi:MAG: putative proton-coupled thiamine transporter YuaJ [Thermoleophilia bacterium]|nr:putative proton-coupled thiamine transporter YuaJ [Thermoleophilia bacterium]
MLGTDTHHARVLALTEAAMAVALSVLLGNLRLIELPNGGSIAFATLPLLALAASRGLRIGIFAGLCAGAAHALAGGTIVHPIQLLLDYVFSYAALAAVAVAGRPTGLRLALGTVLAMALHLTCMVISGVVFFAPVVGDNALAYSLAYNAATVVPELIIALVVLPSLVQALARANPSAAWRRGIAEPPPARPRVPRPLLAPPPSAPDPAATAPSLAARPAAPHVGGAAPRGIGEDPPRSAFRRPAPFSQVRSRRASG